MKLTDQIRNFFYVATHPNQVIAESDSLRAELAEQSNYLKAQIQDLDNALAQRSNEAKMWKKTVAQTLPAYHTAANAKELYEMIAAYGDPTGGHLFYAIQDTWGDFPRRHFAKEELSGSYVKGSSLDYHAMSNDHIRYLKDAYPSFSENENAIYTNAMVRMGILPHDRIVQVTPDPIQKVAEAELAVPGNAKTLYEKYALRLDPGGYMLFNCAQSILGQFDEAGWVYEANTGVFDAASGHDLMKYLLVDNVAKLGDENLQPERWQVVPGASCERCIDFSMEITPQYEKFENELYCKVCAKLGLVAPAQENTPVGRIDYLDFNGQVGEQLEFDNEVDFIATIKQDNYCGVPMKIAVYHDPITKEHIDTSFLQDMDPPPQGFTIESYRDPERSESAPNSYTPEMDHIEYDYEFEP